MRYLAKPMAASLLGILVFTCALHGEIFLPGMQPLEGGIEFAKVAQCRMCHAETKNGPADPFLSWQGGMMAQAEASQGSPCIQVCRLDDDGVCIGCLRTIDEIECWPAMDSEARRRLLLELERRRAAMTV